MRISDGSSDGCSSDLADDPLDLRRLHPDFGIGSTLTEPVQAKRPVRIDHDLDDAGIGQRRGDRRPHRRAQHRAPTVGGDTAGHWPGSVGPMVLRTAAICRPTCALKDSNRLAAIDRKSVVSGKSVLERGDRRGYRILTKKQTKHII